jgi:hypothetical protein
MTLHTGPQCSLDKSASFSGNVLSTDCETTSSSNTGCGISDPNPSSYGQGFNDNGGGVYARLWDKDGIKIWFFARPSIPQDISSGNPDPSSWPTPTAFWSTDDCDVATHFYDHSLVIDTTLCGDWAGAVYGNSGCPGTCAQAVADASNFDRAFFFDALARDSCTEREIRRLLDDQQHFDLCLVGMHLITFACCCVQ